MKLFKLWSKTAIAIMSVLLFGTFFLSTAFALNPNVTFTPCPVGSNPNADINSEECVSAQANVNKIDLSGFLPSFGFDDIIGTIAFILLSIAILFFGIKLAIAIYQWVNNDAQNKARTEAIKKIRNGIMGVLISVVAFFATVVINNLVLGDTKIINCATLYPTTVDITSRTGGLSDTSANAYPNDDPMRKCIKITGKYDVLTATNNKQWFAFRAGLSNCNKYLNVSTNPHTVLDRQGLNSCFVDEFKKATK